jgi:hypothetical protein
MWVILSPVRIAEGSFAVELYVRAGVHGAVEGGWMEDMGNYSEAREADMDNRGNEVRTLAVGSQEIREGSNHRGMGLGDGRTEYSAVVVGAEGEG